MERSDVTLMELLADPTIVEALVLLLGEGDKTQKEIAAALHVDSAMASRRMADLERAGVVARERSHGPYRLEDPIAIGGVVESVANAAARADRRRSDASTAHHDRVVKALQAQARRNGGDG